MIKVRPVCGSLDEAMDQVTEHESFDEIMDHLSSKFKSYGLREIDRDKFTIEDYGYDERIDWNTCIILYDGRPVAYSNGGLK